MMDNMFARDNRHLFLEKPEKKANSFVANVNIIVEHMDNVDITANNIQNINLVSENMTSVNTLVVNLDHIYAVEEAIPVITTCSTNINYIVNTSKNIQDVVKVSNNIPTINAVAEEIPTIKEVFSYNLPKLATDINNNRISIEATTSEFYTRSNQIFINLDTQYNRIVTYSTDALNNLQNKHTIVINDINRAITQGLDNLENKRSLSVKEITDKHTAAITEINNKRSQTLVDIEDKHTEVLDDISDEREDTIDVLQDLHLTLVDRAHQIKNSVLTEVSTKTSKYSELIRAEGDREISRIDNKTEESIDEITDYTQGIVDTFVDRIEEAGDTQIDRIDIKGTSLLEEARNEVVKAETAASRTENVLAYSHGNAQTGSFVLEKAIKAGDEVELPVSYIVGSNTLLLSWGGERLYLGLAYEEVGAQDSISSKVKFLMDIMRGYVLNAWVSPSVAYGNVDAVEQRIIEATNHVRELDANVTSQVEIFDNRIRAIDDHTQQGLDALEGSTNENINRLKEEGSNQIGQARAYAIKSRGYSETSANEANRAERAADFTVVLSKGKAINQSWELDEQLKIDDELELPVSYMVGQNTLRLSYGGLELYKDINYEEIGEENTLSNKVKIKFNVLRGYVFNAWIAPTTKSGDIDAIDAKVEETIDKVNALGLSADEYLAKANEYANMIQGKLDSSIDTLNTKTNVLKGDLSIFTNARKDDINSYTQEQLELLSVYADRAEQGAINSENYSNTSKTYSEAAKVSEDNALESANKAANAYNNTVALVKGKAQDATWEIDENLPANTVITLPISYPVGLNLLQLSYGGFLLFKGKDYEEIGEEDSQSNQVKILFEIEEDSVFHAWTSPIVKTADLEAIEERLDTTLNKVNELGDLNQLDAKIDEVLTTIADFNSEQYVELANNLMEELNGVVEEGSQILDNKVRNGKNEVTNYVNNAKNDVNEIVNESLADIVKYRNKAEAAANLAVQKAEYFKAKNEYATWVLDEVVTELDVKIQYIVGYNNLLLYANGLLLTLGYDYTESGEEGDLSSTVTLTRAIEVGTRLVAIGLYSSVREELVNTNNRLDQLEDTVNNLSGTGTGSGSSSGTGFNVVPEGTNLEDDSIGDGLYIVDSDDDNP